MINRAMHSPVADLAQKVNRFIIGLRGVHRRGQCGIREQTAVLDSAIDVGQFLIKDVNLTNIEMSYLRITHLTFWQTNVST